MPRPKRSRRVTLKLKQYQEEEAREAAESEARAETRRRRSNRTTVPEVIDDRSELPFLNGTVWKRGAWNRAICGFGAWKMTTAKLVGALLCCAICGVTEYGSFNTSANGRVHFETDEAPLYALANVLMVPHMKHESGAWLSCSKCIGGPTDNVKAHTTFLSGSLQHRIQKLHPMLLQGLSCINIAVNVQKKYNAYAKGNIYESTLVDNALIGSSPSYVPSHLDLLHELLADGLRHNAILMKFKTVMEINPGALGLGLAIVSSTALNQFMRVQQLRGPLNMFQLAGVQEAVSMLVDVEALGTSTKLPEFMLAGRTTLRRSIAGEPGDIGEIGDIGGIGVSDGGSGEIRSNTQGLLVNQVTHTLEMLLFPYLFPGGFGAYTGFGDFHQYMKYRMRQGFTLFTMIPQYILYMYQLKQAQLFRMAIPLPA